MILGFSTKINGKPTYFVERIHSGLILNDLMNGFDAEFANKDFSMDAFAEKHMKLHTIREDPKDRWKKGNKIDFFINVRKKDMFRFAPVLSVTSIQNVFMSYAYGDRIEISINGRQIHNPDKLLEFAQNDGFDTWEDFFNYFYPLIKKTPDNWFVAKIIHWTDLRY